MQKEIVYFWFTRTSTKFIRKSPAHMIESVKRPASIKEPGVALEQMIVNTIIKHAQPARIILFGSHARADAHARSDYDTAIDDSQLTPALLAKLRAELEPLPTLLNIDLVWMNRAVPALRQRILSEGKILYG